MNILFIGITDHMSDSGYDHIFDFFRFELLVHYGTEIPDNTCIWISWDGRDYMDCGTDLYGRLNTLYSLEKRGLDPTRSLFLPDPLIWDASHDLLMILGRSDDLCTYIKGLRKFSPSALQIDDFPDFYIYKMASSVYEKADEYGNMSRNLVVDDLGFLQ